MSSARRVSVRGMGVRRSEEISTEMYNYGHFQVLLTAGSARWYEAGWGPMISETAFFVKDIISSAGCVSIVMDEGAKSEDIDLERHMQDTTMSLSICLAADESIRTGREIEL